MLCALVAGFAFGFSRPALGLYLAGADAYLLLSLAAELLAPLADREVQPPSSAVSPGVVARIGEGT
jgi:hypothetical protein